MVVKVQKEYELYLDELFSEFATADEGKLKSVISVLDRMEKQFREKCVYLYNTGANYDMISDCERNIGIVEELKDILLNTPVNKIKNALRQLELKYDYCLDSLISDYDGDFIKEVLENAEGSYFYIYNPDYDVFTIYEL